MDNFKLVTVIPINRGIFIEELTYFSSRDTAPGDLVTITARGKAVAALVTSVEDAKERKSNLRKSTLALKKLSGVKKKKFVSKEFLDAAREAAFYFATTSGQLMSHFIPKIILEKGD